MRTYQLTERKNMITDRIKDERDIHVRLAGRGADGFGKY
jgi:hypothetical protein